MIKPLRPLYGYNYNDAFKYDPNESDNKDSLLEKLRYYIKQLPPKYREVIEDFHFSGLSIVEISQYRQLPQGTIKTYLRKARILLRRWVEDDNVL